MNKRNNVFGHFPSLFFEHHKLLQEAVQFTVLTSTASSMVRTYKRKTSTPYTKAEIESAIKAVRTNELTPTAAAEKFKIPLPTLYSRLSGRRGDGPRGGRTILHCEEEKFLVETIEIFEKWQLPLLRQNVIEIARNYMIELGKQISPTATLNEWFSSFMTRHPELKLTKCVNLEKVRSISCTTQVVSK